MDDGTDSMRGVLSIAAIEPLHHGGGAAFASHVLEMLTASLGHIDVPPSCIFSASGGFQTNAPSPDCAPDGWMKEAPQAGDCGQAYFKKLSKAAFEKCRGAWIYEWYQFEQVRLHHIYMNNELVIHNDDDRMLDMMRGIVRNAGGMHLVAMDYVRMSPMVSEALRIPNWYITIAVTEWREAVAQSKWIAGIRQGRCVVRDVPWALAVPAERGLRLWDRCGGPLARAEWLAKELINDKVLVTAGEASEWALMKLVGMCPSVAEAFVDRSQTDRYVQYERALLDEELLER